MYLLDTNIISFFVKGNQGVVKKMTSVDTNELFSSVLVYGECFAGLKNADLLKKYEQFYNGFFDEITLLDFDLVAAKEFVNHKQKLTEKGKIIETADLIIACTALANNLILVTNNTKHFGRIEGLQVEDWTK